MRTRSHRLLGAAPRGLLSVFIDIPAVSEAKCFLCPPDGLSGRDQPVELLNPARVNHMPSTGKPVRPACRAPPQASRGPAFQVNMERKGWVIRSFEVGCSLPG